MKLVQVDDTYAGTELEHFSLFALARSQELYFQTRSSTEDLHGPLDGNVYGLFQEPGFGWLIASGRECNGRGLQSRGYWLLDLDRLGKFSSGRIQLGERARLPCFRFEEDENKKRVVHKKEPRLVETTTVRSILLVNTNQMITPEEHRRLPSSLLRRSFERMSGFRSRKG